MTTILLALFVFSVLLYWIIILDVILSWLAVFGLRLRPQCIASILAPIYEGVASVIPTRVGPFELAPIIVIIVTLFVQSLILAIDPSIKDMTGPLPY